MLNYTSSQFRSCLREWIRYLIMSRTCDNFFSFCPLHSSFQFSSCHSEIKNFTSWYILKIWILNCNFLQDMEYTMYNVFLKRICILMKRVINFQISIFPCWKIYLADDIYCNLFCKLALGFFRQLVHDVLH